MQSITPEQILQATRKLLPDVQAIYWFGSSAHGQTHTESDLDIAVLMPHRIDALACFAAQNKLAWEFNIEVDLVDLRSASTVMNYEVIRTGKRLFCKNKMACTDYEALQKHSSRRFWDNPVCSRTILKKPSNSARLNPQESDSPMTSNPLS